MLISSWSAVTGRHVSDAWSTPSERHVQGHLGLTVPASTAGQEGAVGGMSGARRFALSSAARRASARRKCPVRTGEMHGIADHEGAVEQLERFSASANLRHLACTQASARKPPSYKRRESFCGAPAMIEELPSVTGDEEGLDALSAVIAAIPDSFNHYRIERWHLTHAGAARRKHHEDS
jgi:hypothetical protein